MNGEEWIIEPVAGEETLLAGDLDLLKVR